MKVFILFFVVVSFVYAKVSDKEIANLFILGFYGTSAKVGTQIHSDICKGLGGVILFGKSPVQRGAIKNFATKKQLQKLIYELKSCNTKPFIAIDQEGGAVERVKFTHYPSAKVVAKKGSKFAKKTYLAMAKELHELGFNLNFAPVADVAINPKNRVIVKWGRSFGNVDEVIKYDSIFIDAMHQFNIATTLKHFPGHGSSFSDTHKGFVDVSFTWQEKELLPYKVLKNKTDAVMVAHIFNKNLDPKYPASLSKKIVTNLLKEQIGFRGVVISDDLQMGAIRKYYGLKEVIAKSLNAGVDVMLFANQVSPSKVIHLDTLIKITKELLKEKRVSEARIKEANQKINQLKARLYQ